MKVTITTDDGEVYETLSFNEDDILQDKTGAVQLAFERDFWDTVEGYLMWKNLIDDLEKDFNDELEF